MIGDNLAASGEGKHNVLFGPAKTNKPSPLDAIISTATKASPGQSSAAAPTTAAAATSGTPTPGTTTRITDPDYDPTLQANPIADPNADPVLKALLTRRSLFDPGKDFETLFSLYHASNLTPGKSLVDLLSGVADPSVTPTAAGGSPVTDDLQRVEDTLHQVTIDASTKLLGLSIRQGFDQADYNRAVANRDALKGDRTKRDEYRAAVQDVRTRGAALNNLNQQIAALRPLINQFSTVSTRFMTGIRLDHQIAETYVVGHTIEVMAPTEVTRIDSRGRAHVSAGPQQRILYKIKGFDSPFTAAQYGSNIAATRAAAKDGIALSIGLTTLTGDHHERGGMIRELAGGGAFAYNDIQVGFDVTNGSGQTADAAAATRTWGDDRAVAMFHFHPRWYNGHMDPTANVTLDAGDMRMVESLDRNYKDQTSFGSYVGGIDGSFRGIDNVHGTRQITTFLPPRYFPLKVVQ